jgi:dTDP-4-dehydrorhamnose reductase
VTVDLADPGRVAEIVARLGPEAVIHAAALADLRVGEREPERAARDNERASMTLAHACAANSARLIAISTDLVFGGESSFSTEASPTNPRMEYGRSKARAESAVLGEHPASVIFRVGLICGRGYGPRRSGSEALVQRLRRGETVTLYEDEWRTPVDPESIAQAIEAVLDRPTALGIYHIAGKERLTRVELGERVAALHGLDSSLIQRAPQASHRGAPRPRDVSLDTARAIRELGFRPRRLDEVLREGREG